jgi:hypothetical protein
MAIAIIAGLDYDSPIIEFNVRPEPGTVPDVIAFKAQKGAARLEILDVQPDNQGMKQPNGEVYQWFKLRFADGREGWLRSHILTIEGDLTGFGYGVIAAATYAYRLTRIMAAVASAPTIAAAPSSPAPVTTPTPAPTSAVPTTPPPAPTPTTPPPAYTGATLYRVPMARYRFIRGFTGPQPNHPGVDYGADDGEPIVAGPAGGLVVASRECVRCNIPGKPSTVLQGFSLGDPRIFSDLHEQLPNSTRQALAARGMAGAHIYAMYAHLNRRDAEPGATLHPGQPFATCGNTGNSSGPHLHLELRASTNATFPGWAAIAKGLIDPLLMFER